eukprot:1473111-Prymnesium_polylepis.2
MKLLPLEQRELRRFAAALDAHLADAPFCCDQLDNCLSFDYHQHEKARDSAEDEEQVDSCVKG